MTDDQLNTVKSVADATKSVSETAQRSMDLVEKAGRFFAWVLGEDAAGVLKDVMFYFRAKNAISLQGKLDHILKQRRIENPKAIPLRLAIPFLEAATLEDDDTLQKRWARLLANAMDPTFRADLIRQHGEVLKVISPLDCMVLETMECVVRASGQNILRPEQIADEMSIPRQSMLASLYRLKSLGLVDDGYEVLLGQSCGEQPFYDDRNLRHITEWGRMFLKACSPERSCADMETVAHGG